MTPLKRVVSAQESENLSLISTLAGFPGDDSTVQGNISRARDEQKKKIYIYVCVCARQRTFSYDRSGITRLNSWSTNSRVFRGNNNLVALCGIVVRVDRSLMGGDNIDRLYLLQAFSFPHYRELYPRRGLRESRPNSMH